MLNAMHQIGDEDKAVMRPWMIDNGAFSGRFNPAKWAKRLAALSIHQETCIGAVIPDAVCNNEETIQMWREHRCAAKRLGYRPFFVTQNGCTPDDIPIDAGGIFIGGDDRHKLMESRPLIAEAQRRGLWIHVGRVNSAKRIRMFRGCNSADETTIAREPTEQVISNLVRAAAGNELQMSLFESAIQR